MRSAVQNKVIMYASRLRRGRDSAYRACMCSVQLVGMTEGWTLVGGKRMGGSRTRMEGAGRETGRGGAIRNERGPFDVEGG